MSGGKVTWLGPDSIDQYKEEKLTLSETVPFHEQIDA
jgi:hypothetical protein